MRKEWKAENRQFVSRPPNTARQVLLQNCIGGRVDYFVTPADQFETVFETDLTGAYSSVCDHLPVGYCCSLAGEPDLSCVTYYMECTIHILPGDSVPFGIFGIPGKAGNEYPTQPGKYTAWLWKEEVDQCRRAGWIVQPQRGFGWTSWSDGLATWAQSMYALRIAAQVQDATLAAWTKQVIVAALGRFGMPLWQWILLPERSPLIRPGDVGLSLAGHQSGFVLHRIAEWQSNHLTHWYSYVLMRCRLVLRARMQYEYDRGNAILATNYDALYCRLPADPTSLGAHLGAWKQRMLNQVRFPYPRGVISAEKTTLPGKRRAAV